LRSLRWRIATFYALLLLGAIAVVAIVLVVQLRTILLDEARAKVDLVGTDIAALARNTSTSAGSAKRSRSSSNSPRPERSTTGRVRRRSSKSPRPPAIRSARVRTWAAPRSRAQASRERTR